MFLHIFSTITFLRHRLSISVWIFHQVRCIGMLRLTLKAKIQSVTFDTLYFSFPIASIFPVYHHTRYFYSTPERGRFIKITTKWRGARRAAHFFFRFPLSMRTNLPNIFPSALSDSTDITNEIEERMFWNSTFLLIFKILTLSYKHSYAIYQA